jgi:hypothetical protein
MEFSTAEVEVYAISFEIIIAHPWHLPDIHDVIIGDRVNQIGIIKTWRKPTTVLCTSIHTTPVCVMFE